MSGQQTLLSNAVRVAIPATAAQIYIAYSGGVDSHVLLDVCAKQAEWKAKITAVYVHHGLQIVAEQWAQHCQQQAQQLELAFRLLRVNAKAQTGQSPEEAARTARYQALQELVHENEVILVAQHREDQLETVLLQLFRGAGVQGLAAMPSSMGFGNGLLIRPFLDIPKQALQDYARQHKLNWIEDPSNEWVDFERNFLRNQIIPHLKTHWPSIDKTVARSAQHCASAQHLLTELGNGLLSQLINTDNTLSISQLQQLSLPKQQLVIRHWFSRLGLKMPSVSLVKAVFTEVMAAKSSASPALKKAGYVIRRYQDKLYCEKDLPDFSKETGLIVWPQDEDKIQLADASILQRYPAQTGIPVSMWQAAQVTIRFRQGGEKIRLHGRQGQHSLKNLFQETAIPPWQRGLIPLIYLNEQLAAVADMWMNADLIHAGSLPCYQIQWLRVKI